MGAPLLQLALLVCLYSGTRATLCKRHGYRTPFMWDLTTRYVKSTEPALQHTVTRFLASRTVSKYRNSWRENKRTARPISCPVFLKPIKRKCAYGVKGAEQGYRTLLALHRDILWQVMPEVVDTVA